MPPPEQQTAQTSVPSGSGGPEPTCALSSVDVAVSSSVDVWPFI
jgi:hypothetical protein